MPQAALTFLVLYSLSPARAGSGPTVCPATAAALDLEPPEAVEQVAAADLTEVGFDLHVPAGETHPVVQRAIGRYLG